MTVLSVPPGRSTPHSRGAGTISPRLRRTSLRSWTRLRSTVYRPARHLHPDRVSVSTSRTTRIRSRFIRHGEDLSLRRAAHVQRRLQLAISVLQRHHREIGTEVSDSRIQRLGVDPGYDTRPGVVGSLERLRSHLVLAESGNTRGASATCTLCPYGRARESQTTQRVVLQQVRGRFDGGNTEQR